MKICRHLAMTRWEMENFTLPEGFSPAFLPWEADLADLPKKLPKGTLLVLHDKFPTENISSILEAVKKTECRSILLDFQNPGSEAIAKQLSDRLPCSAAITEPYAKDWPGPVFLHPCPPDRPLETHLAPWKGREIWLDIAPEVLELTVTATGCKVAPLPQPPADPPFTHETLCCRYRTEITPGKITFTLWRDKQTLESHIQQAQALGVTKTIGLFQEWQALP